jgi:methyltransferase-like protein
MAYGLPNSQFVGIDLSPRQIAEGQAVIDELGLKNLDLRAASIADVDASFGKFDYIICHGVFSWVPRAIQERIWWISKNLLADRGVAYISYNTYPGWHLKTIVRDLMKYHAARFDDPATKVSQARSILNFMAGASASLGSPLSRVLAEESDAMPKAADYYLYHEHLEDSNQPLYFHEFVSQARAVGLEYLGEAWHHTQIDNLPEEVKEALEAISADLVDLEQFVDFLRSRTFRRTLVTHAGTPIQRTPQPDVLEPMFLEAMVRPQAAEIEITSDKEEAFLFQDQTKVSSNNPTLKAALVELYERWPGAVPFSDLLAAVQGRLQLTGEQATSVRPVLAAMLVRSYIANAVAIHCEPFRFVMDVSERPKASALARLMSVKHVSVATFRHRLTSLAPAERALLRLLDGQRTIDQLCLAAAESVSPHLQSEQQPLASPESLREFIQQSLRNFARGALLES